MKLGIDEAGRGSLIGPMIVAGVVLDEDGEERLAQLGVTDSKRLSPGRRARLLDEIVREARLIEVVPVGARDIDSRNLNALTIRAMDTIIEDALSVFDLDLVILDRVGRSYSGRRAIGGKEVNVVMEEKADARYTVVSAASIVAKVFRDWVISYIRKSYDLPGSGYPSDKETVEWVKGNASRLPEWLIRRKWRTLRRPEAPRGAPGGELEKFLRREEDAH